MGLSFVFYQEQLIYCYFYILILHKYIFLNDLLFKSFKLNGSGTPFCITGLQYNFNPGL